MPVSRLAHSRESAWTRSGMPPTPLGNLDLLRLENLDTAGRPPAIAREIVHAAVEDDVVLPDGAVAGGQRAGGQ
jgi:hypothetical protein